MILSNIAITVLEDNVENVVPQIGDKKKLLKSFNKECAGIEKRTGDIP